MYSTKIVQNQSPIPQFFSMHIIINMTLVIFVTLQTTI